MLCNLSIKEFTLLSNLKLPLAQLKCHLSPGLSDGSDFFSKYQENSKGVLEKGSLEHS